jgi:hypothetical protein
VIPPPSPTSRQSFYARRANTMNNIVYIVGLIVIVIAILSFFGLR